MAAGVRLRNCEEIQGNVLAAFPVEHQAFLLMTWRVPSTVAAWLREIAGEITTTADLTRQPTLQRARPCCGLSFTYEGLIALAPEWLGDLARFTAFREGPAARADKLGDSASSKPDKWVFGGPGQRPVQALLTLACARAPLLERTVSWHQQMALSHGVQTEYVQWGGRLPGAMADHEHFGFRDNIAQPRIENFDVEEQSGEKPQVIDTEVTPPGEFVLGYPRADSLEPWPVPDWMRDGSFQVFKRLRQDVAGWRAQLSRLRALCRRAAMSEEQIAAKLIGRWSSGAPLALAPDRDVAISLHSAFDFEDDPHGFVTPRFAHIRKMHPRMDSVVDRPWRRIIRRAVPFGTVYAPELGTGHGAGVERGLLMNAFMASIEHQFEFLMRAWANDPDFPEADDGPDPLVATTGSPVTLRHGPGRSTRLCLQAFVHTSGAIYAFVPSRSTLQYLGSR